jgi:hypothetical protein
MAKQKKKLETFVTPKGTFKFPYLNTPDKGPKDGSFKMDPVYRVTLVLEGKEADALKKQIDAAHDSAVKEGKADFAKQDKAKQKKNPFKVADKPYRAEIDEDGEETGATEFTFKMKPETKKDDGTVIRRKPTLFDAKGKPAPGTKVGGGTIGKVSFYFYPFYVAKAGAGVSLRLLAAQIIDLKTWGERDAKGYGFGEEEGFEAPEGGDESDADSEDESTNEGEEKGEDLAF